MPKTTLERVIAVISDEMCLKQDYNISEKTVIADLLTEPMDFEDILVAIEDEFECPIEDDEAKSIKTVQDIVNLMDSLTKEQ